MPGAPYAATMVERLTMAPVPRCAIQRRQCCDEEVRHLDVERIHALKHLFRHVMRRPERVDPGIVDQHIDMTVADLDRSSRHVARARRVAQVRRKKIRCASCGTDVRHRLRAALRMAADDDDMDATLGQFRGCRPANPTRSSSNECGRRIGSHWSFLLADCGVTVAASCSRCLTAVSCATRQDPRASEARVTPRRAESFFVVCVVPRIPALEFFHPSGGIDQLLSASPPRMTRGTDGDAELWERR